MPNSQDWFTCPVCDEVVNAGALACPHCGSDDETGWSPDTEYDGMELPFDDEWRVNEGPTKRRKAATFAVVLMMIGLMLFLLLTR